MSKKTRSAIGESLHIHGEAVEHCEALYREHAGEITDEVEEAEAARDLTAREAAEQVARYRLWIDDQRALMKAERERLARLEERLDKRQAWADEMARTLMDTIAPKRTRATVGTYTIGLRRSTAVVVGKDLNTDDLPTSWRREKPERVIPASVEIDKTAAKADLLAGYREGEPPGPGWYDVEGHGRVWLYQHEDMGPRVWTIGRGPGDRLVAPSLDAAGLSIEPEPGIDVLRWKPSPPGVTLEHRTHVKVS